VGCHEQKLVKRLLEKREMKEKKRLMNVISELRWICGSLWSADFCCRVNSGKSKAGI